MKSLLEKLKEKKPKIKSEKKNIFVKIEKKDDKSIYHTKILLDFHAFGTKKNQNYRFFISFRKLFDRTKTESFSLFSLKNEDKFLGISYGCRKPIKNVLRKYEENNKLKTATFSKIHYIQFKFKKGSIFCYVVGISYLLRKDKIKKKYYKSLVKILLTLEKEIYEFYDKKLSNGGLITKWIEKERK
ncbi:PFam50 partition protein (plasmid) [Borreliella afzelii PKo]|uniref:PFam50 partition protein n=1 Tax=Borreliella afzelii (strain PKo) TaxID=390236 RepID=G0ITS1_BORAP|nr:PFam50 partition protein [Borreliella afzelii PKo]